MDKPMDKKIDLEKLTDNDKELILMGAAIATSIMGKEADLPDPVTMFYGRMILKDTAEMLEIELNETRILIQAEKVVRKYLDRLDNEILRKAKETFREVTSRFYKN